MDKFVTLNSGNNSVVGTQSSPALRASQSELRSSGPAQRTPKNPPVSEKKTQEPIRGLHYDLEMLINDKKYKPSQIEELSDQISQGSQSSQRKTRDNRTPERSELSERSGSYRRVGASGGGGSEASHSGRSDRLSDGLSDRRSDRLSDGRSDRLSDGRGDSGAGRGNLAQRKNGDGFSEDELNTLINNYQKQDNGAGRSDSGAGGAGRSGVAHGLRPNVIEIPTSARAQLKAKLDDLVISDSDDGAEESDRYQEKRYNRKHESRGAPSRPSDPSHYSRPSDPSHYSRPSDPSHYGHGSSGNAYGSPAGNTYGSPDGHRDDDDDDDDDDDASSIGIHYSSKLKQPTEKPEEDEDSEEHLSHRQIQTRKQQLMIRSARLKKQGYPPASNLNMTMSLQEMKEIVDIQKEERSLENAIRLQGDVLTGLVTGAEKLNTKFDPADLHLEGWSESFYENLDNYDEVFEDLYYKYSEKVHVEPEIKLIGMVFGSGMAFHFSKSVMDKAGDSVPGFQDIMAKRPDLAQAYREEALNMMSQPGGMPPFHPYMARGSPPNGPPQGPPMNQRPQGPPMNQRPQGPPMNQRPQRPQGPPMNQMPQRPQGPPMNQRPQRPQGQPSEPVGMSPAGMGAPAHAGARAPPVVQSGGGNPGMNQMGNLLNNLTGGNPFLGNLLNNIMSNQSGDGNDDEEDEFGNSDNGEPPISQNRSDFRQRRLTKRQTKATTPPVNKYSKVFQGPNGPALRASQSELRSSGNNSVVGTRSAPPENILNDIDDVDDLLAGILPPMPGNNHSAQQSQNNSSEQDFVRKTRRNRAISV